MLYWLNRPDIWEPSSDHSILYTNTVVILESLLVVRRIPECQDPDYKNF